MSDLSRDEFLSHVEVMRADVREGFKGVHNRLDQQNNRLRTTETDVAVLRDRARTSAVSSRNWGAGTGAAAGGMVTAILAVLTRWFGGWE